MREEVEVLETHPHLRADLVDVFEVRAQLRPIHYDLALLVLLKGVDATDKRGFTRSGWSANHDPLSAINGEVDVLEDVERPVPFVHARYLDGHLIGDLHLAAIYFAING